MIEQDDSVVRADRLDLFQLARQAGIADRLECRHQRAYDELLLAVPDTVAWSWVRSGEWRRRISPILTTVRTVRSQKARSPSAASVRTGLGLTSSQLVPRARPA